MEEEQFAAVAHASLLDTAAASSSVHILGQPPTMLPPQVPVPATNGKARVAAQVYPAPANLLPPPSISMAPQMTAPPSSSPPTTELDADEIMAKELAEDFKKEFEEELEADMQVAAKYQSEEVVPDFNLMTEEEIANGGQKGDEESDEDDDDITKPLSKSKD